MPIVPLRELGALGVNTDVDAYALPPQTFTFAANARFENKTITRGPICKTQGVLTSNLSPKYTISYKNSDGTSRYLIANFDGTITDWATHGFSGGSTENDVTATGWTPSDFDSPYTAAAVNDIVYLNRPDRVPWYMAKGGTKFALLPNWDPTWLCQSMRSVNGVLVALNVSKGGTNFPTMVKTSDFTTFGSVPQTWVGDETNSASENILSDLAEPLIDGWPLRTSLVLYSANETWLMTPTGDSQIFAYQRTFTNRGTLSQNCVVEHQNVHYVFGTDDIWKHDGYRDTTLANGRVRDFIYDNMVQAEITKCFTMHHPRLNEVIFCYVSNDPYVTFPASGTGGTPGCNRAAVYNYGSDCWYFYDLPYVTFGTLGVSITTADWNDLATTTWDSLGESWASLTNTSALTMLMVSPPQGALACAVRSFDVPGSSTALGTVDTAATANALLINDELDLDAMGAQLRGYKVVKTIWPVARFDPGSKALHFSFGSADYANSPPPVYSANQSYDGSTFYKLDFMTAGRFLSVQITYNDVKNFNLSGLDLDFDVTGSR